MANTVIAIRSSGSAAATPSLGVLANGEIALNFADGIIYYKTSSNTLGSIKTTQPAGLTTEVQFNDAGSFGGDSGFTYDKTTDTLTVAGKIIAPSLRGYNALVGIASSTTITFVVTVASKTTNHRYYGTGSGSGYFIDGIESPFITLLPGKTYRFNQEDGSNSSHPLRFYYEADRTTQYSTNVTTSGTPGSAGAYTEIVVTDTTPVVLHYQCSAHGYMGNAAQFNSNVVDTPYQITTRNGIIIGSTNVAVTLAASFNTANAAFLAANAAIATDTTQNNSITAAFITANSAGVYANGAFAAANAANATDTTQNNSITAAFIAANSAGVYANGAFAAANSAGSSALAQAAFNTANASFIAANSAGSYANSAFTAANLAIAIDTTQNNSITAAFIHANASFAFANTISGGSAIDNVARALANTSQATAQAAFALANTDVTNITISPSQTYGNATHSPVITVSANGRINAISTVAVTATDPSAIAFAIALG